MISKFQMIDFTVVTAVIFRNLAMKRFCHVPTWEGSTRDNHRVPSSGTQFPRLHSRTRKAYVIHSLRIYLTTKDLIIDYTKLFVEISAEPRL